MKITRPDVTEPLVRVSVYMYPTQRQKLREQAARRGMAISEYVKYLVAKAAQEEPW